MHVESWRGVDFAGVVLAGFVSGYVMSVAGLWAGRVPGLVSVDVADFGRRYIVSDRPSAWFYGLISHLVNSILLVLLWATVVLPTLGMHRIIAGLLWGLFLAFTFSGTLMASLSGLGFMGMRTGGYKFLNTNVILHLIWGLLIGLIYVPK